MKLVVAAAVAVPLFLAAGAVVPAAMAAGPTASQLASKASADLKAAKTYRMSSITGSGKEAVSTKVTRGSNGCEISLTNDGSTVGFIVEAFKVQKMRQFAIEEVDLFMDGLQVILVFDDVRHCALHRLLVGVIRGSPAESSGESDFCKSLLQ